MDTTSVIAFRDQDGNKGKSAVSRESENSSPTSNKSSASREYREGTFVEDNVLVPYDRPITIFTNYGVGGRFLGNEVSSKVSRSDELNRRNSDVVSNAVVALAAHEREYKQGMLEDGQ